MRDKPCSPTASQGLCCQKGVSEIGKSNGCPYTTVRLKMSSTAQVQNVDRTINRIGTTASPPPKYVLSSTRRPKCFTITIPGMKRLKLVGSKVCAGPFRHLSVDRPSERHSRDRQTILSHLNQAGREHCSHPQRQIPCVCSNWCFP